MNRSGLVLSIAQLGELRATLEQLAQQSGVRCALLADFSGQDVVHWDGIGGVDMSTVAALSAGDLMATIEIGRMLGGRRSCNLIVQEHEDQTILVGRVGEGLLLLLATQREIPLGWSRLAIKRVTERITAIVDVASIAPPPPAVSEDFERAFSAQLDGIW